MISVLKSLTAGHSAEKEKGAQAEQGWNGFHGSGCGLKGEWIIERGMDRRVTKKHQPAKRNLFRASGQLP
jgi:hypothetical protein